MVLHLVLFEPRAGLADATARALVSAIEDAAHAIPSVRRFEVGRRLPDGPAYLVGSPPALSFVAAVLVDDRAGLRDYLEHPAHVALGRLFNETLSSAFVYDFEVEDAGSGTLASLSMAFARPASE